ncbi:hypothetical protein PNOK_0962100 [Pyrrhoderma noxium]|uniref:Uncharacterized protein n=1 Tax=Pyrrhoderma noxium TaxID=2282107 RepID=A0A286U662_9AGAM|nr:hypothetical protein PNOK_0962100 [Pyrrhoderma noxium]
MQRAEVTNLSTFFRYKYLSVILNITIFCETISKFILTSLVNSILAAQSIEFADGTTRCVISSSQAQYSFAILIIDWLIDVIIGFILLILALYKASAHWKTSEKGSSLLHILIKDQIYYYIMIIFCSIMNIISIQIQTNELSAKGILFMTLGNSSLLSLIGNRMFINLKEAGEQQENGGKLSLDGAAFNSNLSSIRFSSRRSAAHTGTSHYTAPRSFFDLDDEF